MNFTFNVNWLNDMTSPLVFNAMLLGLVGAIGAGVVGYFVILRRQTFASHALAHISVPGATGAIMLGLPMLLGIMTFALIGAFFIGLSGKNNANNAQKSDIVTGVVLAFATALGMFFATFTSQSTKTMQSVFFGNLLSAPEDSIYYYAIFLAVILGIILLFFRPLLFSAIDGEFARARGVKIKFYSAMFSLLLCLTITMSIQVAGSLLIFSLLIAPSSAALCYSARPVLAIFLSVTFAMLSVILGLTLAVMLPLPPSFVIVCVSTSIWLLALLLKKITNSYRKIK